LNDLQEWAPDTKTDWPTNCRSKCDFDFQETIIHKSPEGVISIGGSSSSGPADVTGQESRIGALGDVDTGGTGNISILADNCS
jgi:hypothetical protein